MLESYASWIATMISSLARTVADQVNAEVWRHRSAEEFRRCFEENAVMRQEWDGLLEYLDQTGGQVSQGTSAHPLNQGNSCS